MTLNVPTGKSVLLFSGGMDSLIAAWLVRPDVLLFLRHGQRYQQLEEQGLARLRAGGFLPPGARLVESDALRLGEFERAHAIIPLRNLLFVALAAQYGETVYLAAMSGDRSLDKSEGFFSRATDLLTFLYGAQHWCQGRVVRVQAAFPRWTKTEAVRHYLAAGHSAAALLASPSCYDPPGDRRHFAACGWCKPCFRKWVALANNGVAVPYGYFGRDPWEAPWLADVTAQLEAGTYRGAEDAEWLAALAAVRT